jgi:hypothetical protein
MLKLMSDEQLVDSEVKEPGTEHMPEQGEPLPPAPGQ